MLIERELTGEINAAAIEVHRTIGPGLLESAYHKCLARELELRGIGFKREVSLPVVYKGVTAESGYRLDFLVEERVILELKAVESIADIHKAQLLTYLRLSQIRVGVIYNFHSTVLMSKVGHHRAVL